MEYIAINAELTICQSYNKSLRNDKSQTGHCHIPLSQGSGAIMEQRTKDCNNQWLDRTSAKQVSYQHVRTCTHELRESMIASTRSSQQAF